MSIRLVTFDEISLGAANELLVRWGHKMGACNRPNGLFYSHALYHGLEPVAVAITSALIRQSVGGAKHLTRRNTIELSRLCAARRDLCRVVLRLWREFVFPKLGYEHAISYADTKLHTGDLYRFDGWKPLPDLARSGTDSRSGRKGRSKRVWLWSPAINDQLSTIN